MAIARDLLRKMVDEAAAAGHTISIEMREDPQHPMYWMVCTCGYKSTARRSTSAVVSTISWHAGAAAGEADRARAAARVNGRVLPPAAASGL